MPSNSKKLVALATLMTLTLAGCGSTKAFLQAGNTIGTANAGVELAEVPAWCGEEIPHAELNTRTDVRIILAEEREQLDLANDRIRICFEYGKVYRAELAGKGSPETNRNAHTIPDQ